MIETFKFGPDHLRSDFILDVKVVRSSAQVLVDRDHTKMPMKSFSLDLSVRHATLSHVHYHLKLSAFL